MDEKLTRLVEAARRGQPGAFAALVEELRPNIFQLTSRFARTTPDFDDLSQEICLRLWKGLPALREPAAFLGWFKALAVRACYEWLRRRRNRQDREVPLEDFQEPSAEFVASDAAVGNSVELIHAALAQLKPEERLVLTLMELEDQTVREIAALTGWSEGNVKVRAHRARTALRRVIVERGILPSDSYCRRTEF